MTESATQTKVSHDNKTEGSSCSTDKMKSGDKGSCGTQGEQGKQGSCGSKN